MNSLIIIFARCNFWVWEGITAAKLQLLPISIYKKYFSFDILELFSKDCLSLTITIERTEK